MKRNSQATGQGQSATREAPAGGLAPPDERDQTAQSGSVIDRKTLGPRQIIQQATRDITRGLVDTDLHGTPTNVPGPVSRRLRDKPMVSSGGDRRSYAEDQQDSGPKNPPKPPTNSGRPPKGR